MKRSDSDVYVGPMWCRGGCGKQLRPRRQDGGSEASPPGHAVDSGHWMCDGCIRRHYTNDRSVLGHRTHQAARAARRGIERWRADRGIPPEGIPPAQIIRQYTRA